jgi:uncharacterized protein
MSDTDPASSSVPDSGTAAPASAPTDIAFSLDGRSFQFEASAASRLVAGTLVALKPDGGPVQLGQIESAAFGDDDLFTGAGRSLGSIDDDGRFIAASSLPFVSARISRVAPELIEAAFDALGATVNLGALVGSTDIAARVMPHRFNRHTFWCGQSGSGKTYALGVLLERLLIQTSLPMVILDPNADFVRLGELRENVNPADAAQLRARNIRVLRPSRTAEDALRVRFTSLSMRAKAAVLRLDPLIDREEYNSLLHLEDTVGFSQTQNIAPRMREVDEPGAQALAMRTENLRLEEWEVWARQHQAVTEILDERPDATVLDLGGFEFPDEPIVAAMAVLDDLWAKREQRRPILIVIDEAHNLCSPDGERPVEKAVRERIIQIAAEGRKFGLWLLLSTQRPSKIHPSIISQCDNLVLMKMTSPSDLDELGSVFGFVPRALFDAAPHFRQGEALIAGGFAPAPVHIRVAQRLTYEGGSDVRVPMR